MSLLAEENYDALDGELREILQSGSLDRQLEAHWYLTMSLRFQGRYAEALEEARAYRIAAGRANPGIPVLFFARHQAQVLFELARYRGSAALFDSIAKAAVGNSPSQRARQRTWDLSLAANALAALRDTAGFAERIDSVRVFGAMSLLARDPHLHHHLLGMLQVIRGDDRAAAEEFRLAIFAPAGYSRTNYDLARTLLRLGRPREAVAVLQPAVRAHFESSNLYTTRPELRELLAQAWDAVGAPDSALVHYRKVVQAWQHADPILTVRVAAARARITALEAQLPTATPKT